MAQGQIFGGCTGSDHHHQQQPIYAHYRTKASPIDFQQLLYCAVQIHSLPTLNFPNLSLHRVVSLPLPLVSSLSSQLCYPGGLLVWVRSVTPFSGFCSTLRNKKQDMTSGTKRKFKCCITAHAHFLFF